MQQSFPALILSGGRGTRLPNSARDIPKALVEIGGQAILERQLRALADAGFTRVRLALGFRADQIIRFVTDRGLACDWMIEPEALGTGGAVRFAAADFREPFAVLNGDTIADFDFLALARSHVPGHALMAAHWRDDARDFGLLHIEDGLIKEFREKPSEPTAGHINAGLYVLEPEHRDRLPQGFSMLEQHLFPVLAAEGKLRAFEHRGRWEDLGTELRLARMREELNR
ncbi:nucleotidyltransferase family protein [Candidatus Parcubacteria bacterium]|nr:MAG: nucleotidyltransferase family protein [Candidatus Parcubacteria bacterium]